METKFRERFELLDERCKYKNLSDLIDTKSEIVKRMQ